MDCSEKRVLFTIAAYLSLALFLMGVIYVAYAQEALFMEWEGHPVFFVIFFFLIPLVLARAGYWAGIRDKKVHENACNPEK